MLEKTIKEEIAELNNNLDYKIAECHVLREQIKAIQKFRCKHPNSKSFKSGDYSGDTYIVFSCPDCGLNEER